MGNEKHPQEDGELEKAFAISQFFQEWFFKMLFGHIAFYKLRFYLSNGVAKEKLQDLLSPIRIFFERLPYQSKKDRVRDIQKFYREIFDVKISEESFDKLAHLTGVSGRNILEASEFNSFMYVAGEMTLKSVLEELRERAGLSVCLATYEGLQEIGLERNQGNYLFLYHEEQFCQDVYLVENESLFAKPEEYMVLLECAIIMLFNHWQRKSIWNPQDEMHKQTIAIPKKSGSLTFEVYYDLARYHIMHGPSHLGKLHQPRRVQIVN